MEFYKEIKYKANLTEEGKNQRINGTGRQQRKFDRFLYKS